MSNYREMVLVVEDDPQIRNFMKYALEKEEYKVLNAANAATAMNILLSEPVDVMILDLGFTLPHNRGGKPKPNSSMRILPKRAAQKCPPS